MEGESFFLSINHFCYLMILPFLVLALSLYNRPLILVISLIFILHSFASFFLILSLTLFHSPFLDLPSSLSLLFFISLPLSISLHLSLPFFISIPPSPSFSIFHPLSTSHYLSILISNLLRNPYPFGPIFDFFVPRIPHLQFSCVWGIYYCYCGCGDCQ